MKQIFLLLLMVPLLVWAQENANTNQQIQQLEEKLVRVQQETQATFQQFQMIQELRRNEMQGQGMLLATPPPSMSATSVPVPQYEDSVRREQERNKRVQEYTVELDRLYTYYKELDEERRLIIEEIDQLKQSQDVYQQED